ncbi:uncharacterized protein LOC110241764 [Exaiptasia diaphana]|uniref:Uncharacterized protein n=1 Tax=Exaiptasia diaphana TaxID=2652724 RepID=A0A913XEQ1_EXADI|nr:uncharacterized protein LOC110241764 [Exaiptasia diaphana]KXJ12682.1 hypothetical protein AC249_AIPGENE23201 [Exaiptasia diaphana]
MSLGTLFLGAVVMLMITSRCSGDFCDQGPPGKFCLSDLSGYRDCVVVKYTIQEIIRKCPAGTRCNCMGTPCRSANPCRKYRLPPIMPDSYHYEYNEKLHRCSPIGCRTTYSRFAVWRDSKNLRHREDRTIGGGHDPPYEYFITIPYRRGRLFKFHIIPSKRSCTKQPVPNGILPPKIKVPTKFKFYGRKYVYGDYCKRWVWEEGGRNPSIFIDTETWDTAMTINGTPRIVQYSAHFPGSYMSKTSTKIERYYYMFVPGVPEQNVFQLPTYCRV